MEGAALVSSSSKSTRDLQRGALARLRADFRMSTACRRLPKEPHLDGARCPGPSPALQKPAVSSQLTCLALSGFIVVWG